MRGGSRKFRGGESLEQAPPPPPPKPPAEPQENLSSRIVRETNIDSGSSSTSTSSSVVSLFYNKNFWIALLVVLLILSFLGVNFVMLFGQIVQPIVNVFWILVSQILSLFGYTTGTVINKTADVVSGTAKAGLDIAEGTVQSVGNLLIKGSSKDVDTNTQSKLAANILGSPAQAQSPVTSLIQPPTNSIQQSTTIQQVVPSTLDNVLNQSRQKPTKQPAPDASTSAIQSSTAWCFVGEMNGKRSCADVESSGLCLSGQVYKSRAECEGGAKRKVEGFTGNGNLMMATPPAPAATKPVDVPGNIMQSVQAAPTGAVLQLPALGPPQYMGPPNFPPPGMTTVQIVGNPLLAVGPPNYIDFTSG